MFPTVIAIEQEVNRARQNNDCFPVYPDLILLLILSWTVMQNLLIMSPTMSDKFSSEEDESFTILLQLMLLKRLTVSQKCATKQ